jgi:hypothetical protein
MNSGAAVPPPVSGWPNIDVFDVELTEYGMSPIAGMNTGASLLLDTTPAVVSQLGNHRIDSAACSTHVPVEQHAEHEHERLQVAATTSP